MTLDQFFAGHPDAREVFDTLYHRGKHAPLVLTVVFRRRDASPRWKEIVEPAAGRFTHHLESHSGAEIDDEVRSWLQEVWEAVHDHETP